jgi:hypothetical protein
MRHPNFRRAVTSGASETRNTPVGKLSHGLTKEQEVPEREIEVAIRHRKLFDKNPAKYIYEGPDNE